MPPSERVKALREAFERRKKATKARARAESRRLRKAKEKVTERADPAKSRVEAARKEAEDVAEETRLLARELGIPSDKVDDVAAIANDTLDSIDSDQADADGDGDTDFLGALEVEVDQAQDLAAENKSDDGGTTGIDLNVGPSAGGMDDGDDSVGPDLDVGGVEEQIDTDFLDP